MRRKSQNKAGRGRRGAWLLGIVLLATAAMGATCQRPEFLQSQEERIVLSPPCLSPPPDHFIGLVPIVTSPEDDMWPVPSPDGRRIAFVRGSEPIGAERGRNLDVFYVNRDDSRLNPVQFTRHASEESFPSWSPAGQDLYYASNRLRRALTIWRAAIDARLGEVQITARDAHDFAPSLSPDGQKVLFNSYPTGASRRTGDAPAPPPLYPALRPKPSADAPSIWVANADGSQLTQIAAAGYHPRWTPDGKKILFYRSNGENFDVWLMNPDGSEPTQLTNSPADEIEPALSSDLGTLVYAAYDRTRRNFDLWAIEMRGSGGQTQLTFDCGDDRSPAWASDGTLFFQTSRTNKQWDIYGGIPRLPWRSQG